MSALVRGSCPACGRDVALRKGALVREHRGDLCRCGHPLKAHHRFRYNCLSPSCACAHDEPATCTGSGGAERLLLLELPGERRGPEGGSGVSGPIPLREYVVSGMVSARP